MVCPFDQTAYIAEAPSPACIALKTNPVRLRAFFFGSKARVEPPQTDKSPTKKIY
jgi:hypothetical protein